MQVLASSPAIRSRDFENFWQHIVDAGAVMSAFGVVLVDREGQLLVSSRRPFGGSLPKRSELSTQERVFATGKPQVSGVVASTAGSEPIISVEIPVLNGGNVEYVLAVGLPTAYFANVVKSQVPPGCPRTSDGYSGPCARRHFSLVGHQPRPDGPPARHH